MKNEPVRPKRESFVLIVSWVQPKVDDDLWTETLGTSKAVRLKKRELPDSLTHTFAFADHSF